MTYIALRLFLNIFLRGKAPCLLKSYKDAVSIQRVPLAALPTHALGSTLKRSWLRHKP
jgi:hypothetical protein